MMQQGQPGYPPAQGGQPGYPPPGYPGYPSAQGTAYPPAQGYPPAPGYPGYPPVGQPAMQQPGGYYPQHSGVASFNAQGGAVNMQPRPAQNQQTQWMARPNIGGNCPPGLEYLTQVDQLLVHQIMELLEMFTGWETCNKYKVMNSMGQQCFYAFEESDFCQRMCCGVNREFIMHIVDNSNQEVMRVFRPFKCLAGGCCGCCESCQQEITVEAPPGTPIGYAVQQCYLCNPSYVILDASRTPVFSIEGPCMLLPRCPCDYDFNILSLDGSAKIGKITKQWSGFLQESFSDADNFGVTFPMDLDVRVKATLLGLLFLIDFMFFEQSGNDNNRGGGFF